MSITPEVSYLPTRLAGCLVSPEISCDGRKLVRIPQIKKKKANGPIVSHSRIHFKHTYDATESKMKSDDVICSLYDT
jgi:hypothetical protein